MMMDKNPRSDMLKILSRKLARVISKIEHEADAKSPDDVGAMAEEMDPDGNDAAPGADDLAGIADGMEGTEDASSELAEAVDPFEKEVADYMKGSPRRKPRDGTAVMIAGAVNKPKGAEGKRRGIA